MKNEREKIRRRKKNLFKKAHEFGKLCGADVAVIVYKAGHYSTYRSIDQKSWPPTMEQMQITYPPPKNLLPHHIETQIEKTLKCTAKVGENKTAGQGYDIDKNLL